MPTVRANYSGFYYACRCAAAYEGPLPGLGRYDNAVRTGKLVITTHQDADAVSQAIRYYYLSGDLQEPGRYNEAIEAACTSVTLYRRLTMTDSSRWTVDLATSLCGLAHGLAALRDTPEVLIAWREFTSILDNVLNINFDISRILIPTYCRILGLYTTLSHLLKNNEDCHHVSSTAFRYCQQLAQISFVRSVHAIALTALLCRDYALSSKAAQKGSKFCASSTRHWEDYQDTDDANLRPSLLAILSSAEGNLCRCGAAVDYARRAVVASLDIGEKWNVPAMTAEASYMETRGYLAEVLLATGEVVDARQICEERRAYFSKRVDKRMGEYRNLAPILHMLGVLCCAEGCHEDGEAAAQELSEIMKKLGCAFPSLQEQVKMQSDAPGSLKNVQKFNQCPPPLLFCSLVSYGARDGAAIAHFDDSSRSWCSYQYPGWSL